ncbi:MAG: sulfatase/phosphatase domain-containing protein, partial [Cyclobacteriaceae bacterium]
DYAGIDNPSFTQGRSFRKNVAGQTPEDWRQTMYYRYWAHAPVRPGHFGIRNHRYKLAFFYGQHLDLEGTQKENTEPAWEFFDLVKDPRENYNAYNDPEYAPVIKGMKKELLKERELVGDTDLEFPVVKEILERHWD